MKNILLPILFRGERIKNPSNRFRDGRSQIRTHEIFMVYITRFLKLSTRNEDKRSAPAQFINSLSW